MFENQPKGLYAMAFANIGERFGYYTMLAVFALFLKDNFGWSEGWAAEVYSDFLMLVYFLPLIGGIVADKVGFGKCVTAGIAVMFLGYLLLAIPAGKDIMGASLMFGALALISIGTSLFKGNLQVMVGNLYDDPKYAAQRDTGFSIFYMGINVGAMFAPTAAIYMMTYLQDLGWSKADSYHGAFGVACLSLIVSMAVYYLTRSTFKHVDYNSKNAPKDGSVQQVELSPAETKQRIVALCLVFAVVIFFWMAFHQNGSTLTFFAEQFTQKNLTGVETMLFDVRNLVACIVIIYTLFTLFGKSSGRAKGIAGAIMAAAVAYLGYQYVNIQPETIEAPIFQQFNAAFVVGLTPLVMAVFGWLAKKGKEPSAPRKIGYGMFVAGLGYVVMVIASLSLLTPAAQKVAGDAGVLVSPNWLISTYFVLTIAELLLSPMGISFVSKVAPPKYKGMMMGGWFVATAIGNKLVAIPGYLWGDLPLTVVWGVLIALCLISFIFIFSIMKKLEKVC